MPCGSDLGEPAQPRSEQTKQICHRVWLDVHQALRPLDEHAVAQGAHVRMGGRRLTAPGLHVRLPA